MRATDGVDATIPEYGELPLRTAPSRGPVGWWRSAKASLAGVLIARQKKHVRLMILVILAAAGAGGLTAKLAIDMVNHGIVLQDVPLKSYLTPTFVLAAVTLVLGQLASMSVGRIGYVVEFDLRSWVYQRVQNASLLRLDAVTSGQMLTRVQQDLTAVDELIKYAPVVVTLVPLLLGLMGFLIYLSPAMGLLTSAALPVNLYILSRMRGRLRGLSWMELNESAEVTTAVVEPVLGIRVVHAFHRRDEHRSRLAAVALRAYQVSLTKARLVGRFDLLLKSVPVLINAVALWAGAHLVSGGGISVGTFGYAIGSAASVTALAASVDQLAVQWQTLRGSQDRFSELLRLPQVVATEGVTDLPPIGTGLQVHDLVVERGGRPVLSDLDVDLLPGELVVVTGSPGSGKSTLAGVLAGNVPAQSGSVVFEGLPWSDLSAAAAQQAVRVVSETSILFAGTVLDNLLMGVNRDLADGELEAALDASGAAQVIANLDGGLLSPVGDRGLTLSGGQRQRIALARAVITRPRVLVLDDALSAVQPALELEILAGLRAYDPNLSILFVTRRDNAASVADAVVALPDPAPVEAHTADPDDAATTELLDAGARAAAGLSQLSADPVMRALTARLDLTTETPHVGAEDLEDGAPTPRELASRFRKPALLALTFLVVTTLTQTIPALLLGRIIDQADKGQYGGITQTALITAGLGVLAGIAAYGGTVNTGLMTQGITYVLRRRVFQRVSALGIDYYDRELAGQVATRVVNDLLMQSTFLSTGLFPLIVQILTVVISLTMIGVVAPQIALTVLLFGLGLIGVTWYGTRFINRAFIGARLRLGVVLTHFEEDFSGVLDIRNLGAVAGQTRRFVAASRELWTARRRAIFVTAFYSQWLTFVGAVASVLVLVQAGHLVLSGAVSVGLALTIQNLTKTATTPFTVLTMQYNVMVQTAVSWRRLGEFWDPPLLPEVRADARPCPPLRGEVVFDDVVFRYPHTDRVVLQSLSATFPAGSVVALVGYTGAGKSSITKLLQRAYDPDLGSVRVDGVDLRDLDLKSYRQRVGVVPQDAYLFRGTVASNIAYGRPGASLEKVLEAAARVGATGVIASLPGGFDAYVAEGGANLTGAQRQLISLARACIAEPDVLILDEATSALDTETERQVLRAVTSLGCTTIAVTHRESVVAVADHVLVIDGGRVVESGAREDVVGAGGSYDRLWRAVPAGDTLDDALCELPVST